jgi:signal transduction histidine kinase
VTGVIGRTYRARHTVRARFALLYSAMFFVSGLVLLAIPVGFVHGGSTSRAAVTAHADPQPSPARSIANSQQRHDVHAVILGSLVALVVLVVVSAALGWWLSGRLLTRLRTITDTARDISASNLHRRLAIAGPDDEFKELGTTLDDLFARLESSFNAQRRFVANASHELRTPLTAERTVLQVALADPKVDTATLREACEQVLTLGAQQERLIDALLTLANSERGIERRERHDLSEIARLVLDSRQSDVARRDLHVTASLDAAPVDGERQLLDSLVANLVDNAIRYNIDSGRIDISTSVVHSQARLSIRNTGPVVPPSELPRLFRPFQRLAADRTSSSAQGHGLGLAIVQAIIDAHRATLSVAADPDGGLELTVDFPTVQS